MTGLDSELVRFVLTSIPSVPFLEALLLLRSQPQEWDADMLADRLYISPEKAAALLQNLVAAGVAECTATDRFCFAPKSESLNTRIDELARNYPQHLIEITRLIHSLADRNAQQFADAFRLRKDP